MLEKIDNRPNSKSANTFYTDLWGVVFWEKNFLKREKDIALSIHQSPKIISFHITILRYPTPSLSILPLPLLSGKYVFKGTPNRRHLLHLSKTK
jgi:hypothetical protein